MFECVHNPHASARTFPIRNSPDTSECGVKRAAVSRSSYFAVNESKRHSKLRRNCKPVVIYVKTTNQNSSTLLIYIRINLQSEELRAEADVDKMHSDGINSNNLYVALVCAGVGCMISDGAPFIRRWLGRQKPNESNRNFFATHSPQKFRLTIGL